MAVILVIGFFQFYTSNVKKAATIYIPTGSTYSQVLDTLRPHLKDMASFEFIAKRKNYPELVKPGKFYLFKDASNLELVNMLGSGNQEKQEVKIKSYWSVYDMSGGVSKYFEEDSLAMIEAIKKRAKEKKLSEVDAYKVYILAGNYKDFYWTDTPDAFLDRMEGNYEVFWTPERDEKARELGLNRLQAEVIASIVQRETIKEEEQPKVARLYLNRFKKGMRLEADPTLVYLRQKENNYDATIYRVYNKDIQNNPTSPYNTYKNAGLPPLPICIPYKGTIDAVLNPDDNDYIFMCAQPGRTGYHNFAVTYEEHKDNAKLYRDWADEEGVK